MGVVWNHIYVEKMIYYKSNTSFLVVKYNFSKDRSFILEHSSSSALIDEYLAISCLSCTRFIEDPK